MATSIEAYKKFELKYNNGNTASALDFGIGEFVLLFNDQQMRWTCDRFEGRSKMYELNDVQFLITPDKPLIGRADQPRYTKFDLPNDYINYISSYALASKDGCSNRVIYNYQVKLDDLNDHLRDDNNKPSFEYHEAPATVSQDEVQVYKTDFSIDSVFLTYYRYPKPIDIAGYTKLDGSASVTSDPELYDQAVDEVINWCVIEAERIAGSPEGFQLSKDRIS